MTVFDMAGGQRYIATVDVDTDREDLGVQKIAFTANPAIIIKGVAFSAEETNAKQAKDAVKMRIAAPVLIPTEIYRRANGGVTLVFNADEIAGIQQDFMKRLDNKNPLFKLEHPDPGSSPAYILETWIVEDAETDKANTVYNLDVPTGSWVVVIQVTDRAYYDDIVAKGATGLSIEGFLGHKLEMSNEENKDGMAEKDDEVKTELPDGTYPLKGGGTLVIKDGKVQEDKPEEEKAEEVEEVKLSEEELADGSKLSFEGELAVGSKTTAEPGTYETKSGKIVIVADGAIADVKDKAAEELEAEPGAVVAGLTEEQVDEKIEAFREEMVQRFAQLELMIEDSKKPGETENGEKVEMSAEDAPIHRLGLLREGLAALRGTR